MEHLLKPEKLNINPESPTAAKEWNHWLQMFENFLDVAKVDDEDKTLKILQNSMTCSVYEYISESTTYADAIQVLNDLYLKPKSEIFVKILRDVVKN